MSFWMTDPAAASSCRRESLAPFPSFGGERYLADGEEDITDLGMEIFGILCANQKTCNGAPEVTTAPSRLGNPLVKDRAFFTTRVDRDWEASCLLANNGWNSNTSPMSS